MKTFDLTEDFTYEKLQRHYDREAIPLFLRRGQDELLVFSQEDERVTQPGDTLVVFMPPIPRALEPRDQASFEQLVERALFVELSETTSFEDIVRQASALFAHRLPIAADRLAKGFLEGSRYGATPVSHGVALPHYRLAYITQPEMVMVRCQSGVSIAFDDLRFEDEPLPQGDTEPVYAMLFLVSPEENPGQHLRILAHIANQSLRLVTWLCRVTQKQTALPSYTCWVRQSRRAVRCAAEPRNEFPGRSKAVPAKAHRRQENENLRISMRERRFS
ncbi:MAG: PTS sugar transporter subunit IIA, partial [Bacteroidetes bacterium]|nr:PTS sugar transporter subunit IIA [Bacteroidota bacterium]